MITLSKSAHSHQNLRANETRQHSNPVETAGSLAMLYHDGLLTVGQYDEFISSNPFAVDYSMYSSYQDDNSIACGFLSDFANAVSVLGGADAGFSNGGFCGGGCCCDSGFSSVC